MKSEFEVYMETGILGGYIPERAIGYRDDNTITPIYRDTSYHETELWGDRIFEKCGIRRDEEGDGGKTLEIRGKRRLSARDGGANYQQS